VGRSWLPWFRVDVLLDGVCRRAVIELRSIVSQAASPPSLQAADGSPIGRIAIKAKHRGGPVSAYNLALSSRSLPFSNLDFTSASCDSCNCRNVHMRRLPEFPLCSPCCLSCFTAKECLSCKLAVVSNRPSRVCPKDCDFDVKTNALQAPHAADPAGDWTADVGWVRLADFGCDDKSAVQVRAWGHAGWAL